MATSTKNVKGDRKVVRVSYRVPDAIFKIPDGLDLEDKTIVSGWYVKYGTLIIDYVDGREEEIEWTIDPTEFDYKWAENTAIENADDCCVEYSDDEEED
tara:strand:- start:133 stop:429 length:297 start_codon:yes stop_codon:yes gene_type:complete